MKRLIGLVVLVLMSQVGSAYAQGSDLKYSGALGFHNVEAPIGLRMWLTDRVAIDAGLGIGSDENPAVDENMSHWAVDVGIPILLGSFDRMRFSVRPGLLYRSQEVVVDPGPPLNTDTSTQMALSAELEAEVFLTDNFSVSAAEGFSSVNTNPAVGPSTSDWGTTGANFTNIGFHVYVFGKK